MAEFQLTLSTEERQCLQALLEQTLKEMRVEEHRTRTLSYREFVLQQEGLIQKILGKVRRPPE
jgi:hypothetical protein